MRGIRGPPRPPGEEEVVVARVWWARALKGKKLRTLRLYAISAGTSGVSALVANTTAAIFTKKNSFRKKWFERR